MADPVCYECKHLHENSTRKEGLWCDAFPERDPETGESNPVSKSIPDSILSGRNKHTSPVPGDHGIRFERASADVLAKRKIPAMAW